MLDSVFVQKGSKIEMRLRYSIQEKKTLVEQVDLLIFYLFRVLLIH